MSIRPVAPSLVVLALVGALSGCVVNESEASATFLWDPNECAESGIRVIDIDLEDLDDGSLDEYFGIDCADGGFSADDLDAGRYVVTFWGDGLVLFDQAIRLRGSSDNQFDVVLTP